MKVIGLMPVRNESWILRSTLDALSKICDAIIIADQASEDGTREICREFPSVVLIDNNETGHSNKVRWKLLDTARSFEGNNLLLSIDADEFIPPVLFNKVIEGVKGRLTPGRGLEFLWAQLWKSLDHWRDDQSVWSNNWKPIGFLDDRTLDYDRNNVVINDHTGRVPGRANHAPYRVLDVPLVHLQWAAWERAQIKQAWYRCAELISGAYAETVNQKYAITLDDPTAVLSEVDARWYEDIQLEQLRTQVSGHSSWHLREMRGWFDQRGINFFEPLQIWHIPQLQAEFVQRAGRAPRVQPSVRRREYLAKLAARIRRLAGLNLS